ncbi:MAG: ribosome-associated translation inhibitor RaiA [Flavobacteriaceae bacterium]|nr:ribosome-associated translation inhibitor RaiA [Flavobacteriaceae bacterium]
MKVFVQAVNFNADKELVTFVEQKVATLEKYYDRIVDTEVFLKVQKTSEKENKFIEIKVNLPGDDIIVKKECKHFEEGINLSIDSLKRMLSKKKLKPKSDTVKKI